MTYLAIYSVYSNCHITNTEEHEIRADSKKKALAKAKELGRAIEESKASLEKAFGQEPTDWWAHLEELLPQKAI